jgi:hypothetical protein
LNELLAIHPPQPARRVTVETLSTAPRVLRVDGFLNRDECQHIIDMAGDKMDRSTIAEAGLACSALSLSPARTL